MWRVGWWVWWLQRREVSYEARVFWENIWPLNIPNPPLPSIVRHHKLFPTYLKCLGHLVPQKQHKGNICYWAISIDSSAHTYVHVAMVVVKRCGSFETLSFPVPHVWWFLFGGSRTGSTDFFCEEPGHKYYRRWESYVSSATTQLCHCIRTQP